MSSRELSIDSYTLTTAVRQLFSVVDNRECANFNKECAVKLKAENSGLLITLHVIDSITQDGKINFQTQDTLST